MPGFHSLHFNLARQHLRDAQSTTRDDMRRAQTPEEVSRAVRAHDTVSGALITRNIIAPLTRPLDLLLGTHGNPLLQIIADHEGEHAYSSIADVALALPTSCLVPVLLTYPIAQVLCVIGAIPKAIGSYAGIAIGAAVGVPHAGYLANQRARRIDAGIKVAQWLEAPASEGDATPDSARTIAARALRVSVETLEAARPWLAGALSPLDRARIVKATQRARTPLTTFCEILSNIKIATVPPAYRAGIIRAAAQMKPEELHYFAALTIEFCACRPEIYGQKLLALAEAKANERIVKAPLLEDLHDTQRRGGAQGQIENAFGERDYARAEWLVDSGVWCGFHDIEAALQQAHDPAVLSVVTKMLHAGMLTTEQLPADIALAGPDGSTLVMNLFALNADSKALQVMQLGFPAFVDGAAVDADAVFKAQKTLLALYRDHPTVVQSLSAPVREAIVKAAEMQKQWHIVHACVVAAQACSPRHAAMLLVQGHMEWEALAALLVYNESDRDTMVMHLFDAGCNERAMQLIAAGMALFPAERATYSEEIVLAARTTLLALYAEHPELVRTMPQSLRDAVWESSAKHNAGSITAACLVAGKSASSDPKEALAEVFALGAWAKDVAHVRALLASRNFEFWSQAPWEESTATSMFTEVFRQADLHTVLMARYLAVSPTVRNASRALSAPEGEKEKRAWLDKQLSPARNHSEVRVFADRDAVSLPPEFAEPKGAVLWRSPMYVSFANELGIDAGALSRDWLHLGLKKIFNPASGMFTGCVDDPSQAFFHPDVAGTLSPERAQLVRIAGRAVGRALLWNQPTGQQLNKALMGLLMGRMSEAQMLAALDKNFAASLQGILACPGADELDMYFVRPDAAAGDDPATVELKPGGVALLVTDDNKEEYVRLVTHERVVGRYKAASQAFATGFYDVIPAYLLAHFAPAELGRAIAGKTSIDCADWRVHSVVYDGENQLAADAPTPDVVTWMWQAVNDLGPDERKKFLHFVTSATATPVGGFAALEQPFKVQIIDVADRVPEAHACFNTLDLPRYTSQAQFNEKFKYVLQDDGSFSLN